MCLVGTEAAGDWATWPASPGPDWLQQAGMSFMLKGTDKLLAQGFVGAGAAGVAWLEVSCAGLRLDLLCPGLCCAWNCLSWLVRTVG